MHLSMLVVVILGADAPAAKVNFKDQVSAIFQSRCNSCHNNDKQKGGLNLETYGNTMKGGSSGKVVEPGDPDNSRLLLLAMQTEEPKMPPNAAKIPDAELEIIKKWIEGGALETFGSVAALTKPKMDFKLDPASIGKPAGPPAMPEGVTTEPVVVAARPGIVTAMAASPWAPLVAVASHKQVLIYNTKTYHLSAVLPFPEGTIHSLKFSRDGGLLLAGGGRGGQMGRAVAWDVKTAQRLFEVGKEYDAVLAADISPDRSMVALGGPSKTLRVYATADGELVYESKKHTEWITAVEFSPDGVLLASGDRNGGLMVWEAATGREFHDLRGHQQAITDLAWRLDSNLLASASEDNTVRLWEMNDGKQIKSIGAHGGGALSVRIARDGRIVTSGRDRAAKIWEPNGNPKRGFGGFPDLVTRAVFTQDETAIVAADFAGEVRIVDANTEKRLATLSMNPAPIASRLAAATSAWTTIQTEADAATREFEPIRIDAETKRAQFNQSQDALNRAKKLESDAAATLAAAEKTAREAAEAEPRAAQNLKAAEAELAASLPAQEVAAKSLREQLDAMKAAAEAVATSKTEADGTRAEIAVVHLTAATHQLVEANARQNRASLAIAPAKTHAVKTAADRAAAAGQLEPLRKAVADAKGAVPPLQITFDASKAASEAASKREADRSPTVQAIQARTKEARAEVEALTTEKAVAEAAKNPSTARAGG